MKFWIPKYSGTPLPKKVLAPFEVMEFVEIDDKKLLRESVVSPAAFMWLLSLPFYLTGIIMGIIVLIDITNTLNISLTILFMSIGIALHYKANKMQSTKFQVYDREKGMFLFPKIFSKTNKIFVWNDCEGRIIPSVTIDGFRNDQYYQLALIDRETKKMVSLESSTTGIKVLLSYWSFLVQYMNKNGPLPNIPQLQNYPNLDVGYGDPVKWDEKIRSGEISDPWESWKTELQLNRNLDVINKEYFETLQ